MDYVREAVEILKNYDRLEVALANLKDEIIEIRIDLKNIKSVTNSDMPRGGNGSLPGDDIINKMYRQQKAEEEYRETRKVLKRMNKTFETFEKYHKEYAKILRGFYINQYKVEQLAKDFNYTERYIWTIKNKAIRAFAIELFGIKAVL